MASPQWLQKFPGVSVTHLPRIASDHCPILISTEAEQHFWRPFRFEHFWTVHSAARSMISQIWHLPVRGNAIYRLSRRLMLTRRRLSRWNRSEVGDLVSQVELVEADITAMQEKEDREGFLGEVDLSSLRDMMSRHHSLLRQQEMFWRQRSRVQWIREGDRNTRFFHQATLKRRAANRIRRLVDEEGQNWEDSQSIRDLLLHFFRTRWTEATGDGVPVVRVPESRKVSTQDNVMLVSPITGEEIRAALWDLGQDKAPGPDGFPPLFYRHYWDIVGVEVVQAIQMVFQSKRIPLEWNRTLISLVPKRTVATLPQHFRPISLCTTLYKVCARLLAARLRLVLPRLISAEQGAFIRGRSISDNVLIAQEFMHDLHRAPTSRCLMAVKLDMERAYDRLNWDFLLHSLQEFGFDTLFIEWVMACIERPSFSLIINGNLTEFFHSSVGLRQGCPLSPLLFILAADDLSRAFHQAERERRIVPFMDGSQGPSVSHLLFADDCILLGQASIDRAASLHSIVESYCQASGQRVNFLKSSICFSPKTKRSVKEAIINLSGISTQTDRFMYLGIPITGRSPRCSDFTEIERRVRQRIEGWQVTSLSMMARVVIIRSVLSSLPLYLLANAAIPITCLRRMERCFRDFLWASMQDGRGSHLLSWDSVCLPTREGGLGVQSLIVRREALLARHASRFLLEPQSLWCSMMRARYGDWPTGSLISASRGSSSFWRQVCRYGQSIRDHTSWSIGDGSSIDVIQDTWISDLPLSRWPSFFSMDVPSSLRVQDLIAPDSPSWQVPMVTSLFGEELSRRIISLPITPGCSTDARVWQRSCLSRAPSRDLMQLFSPTPERTKDAAWIWKLPIIPRIQLFIWKLLWDCLPTCVLLSRRGRSIQSICPLCREEEETSDHAIFLCSRARRIWFLIGHGSRFDGSASPRSSFFQDIRWGPLHSRGLWAVTAYQIWLSRNQLIFSEDSISPRRIVRKIRSLSEDCARLLSAVDFGSSGLWGSPAASAANRNTVFLSWEPPPPGFVKINFDGSVRGRSAGSAFIIRGPAGDLRAAGGLGSLDSSVPMAELYAAWAGISYAVRNLHAHRILIEGDSLTVVSWLQRENPFDCPSTPILRDIWSILRELGTVRIRHIYREANSAADWVAASVAQHGGSWSWRPGEYCPILLTQILYSDVSGLTHTRSV